MKIKLILISLIIWLSLLLPIGGDAMARSGFNAGIQGVYYNFNATGGEWALKVDWAAHPDTNIPAEDFEFKKIGGQWETEVSQVENRIQEVFYEMLIAKDLLTSFDEDDECRQDPPILGPNEYIIVEDSPPYREWLWRYRKYFKIHIYSQNPLNFITRFSKYPIPDNWWEQ